MKILNRYLSLLLAIIMCISVLPITSIAADATGLDYFVKRNTFKSGIFTDVSKDDWFYDNVKTAYELGLMLGRGDNIFDTESGVTIAETITIAARLHSIYYTGSDEFEASDPWYKSYANYALANGIVTDSYSDYNAPATRADFAMILVNALPSNALEEINQVASNAIPDVSSQDECGTAVYKLYRAGIMIGNDEAGSFAPDSEIKRSEVAAIVTRMADVSLRQSVRLGNEYTVTFNMNSRGKQIADQKVVEGYSAEMPENPSVFGYVFKGWFTQKNGGTEFDFSAPIYADTTIYARWEMDPIWLAILNGWINGDHEEGQPGDEDSDSGDKEYTITYLLMIDGLVNNQDVFHGFNVKENEVLSRPADPTSHYAVFDGWYTDLGYTAEYDFSKPVTEDVTLCAKWEFDTTDADGDGLYDDLEDYFGCDKNNPDTDGDGLDDYTEVGIVKTNPLKTDSDDDGIPDGNEDTDEDGLTDLEEKGYGTNPALTDSDSDDLSDYDEIYMYHTNPSQKDTDGDGAADNTEIAYGTDPTIADDSFNDYDEAQPISETNTVSASVEANVPGEALGTVVVNPITYAENALISRSIPGYLGYAYSFTAATDINYATLTFRYDTSLGKISDAFQPRIYYVNPETQCLEELPNQIVTDGVITARVTHFSEYLAANKTVYELTRDEKQKIIDTVLSVPGAFLVDNNNDNIPDCYNALIYNGVITTGTGSAEFIRCDFSVSADLDGDGTINGKEIEIRTDKNGYTYIYKISDPLKDERKIIRFDNDEQSAINYLMDDSLYWASELETYVQNTKSELLYQNVFSGIGVVTTFKTTKDIYVQEWLRYLNDYSDSIVNNVNINYMMEAYESTVQNIKDELNADISKLILEEGIDGKIYDTAVLVRLDSYMDARNAAQNALTKFQSDRAYQEANNAVMSRAEWQNYFDNEQTNLFNTLKQCDADINNFQAKYIDPKGDYDAAFKNIKDVKDKYSIAGYVMTGLSSAKDVITLNNFYANINANIAAINVSKDLFVELKSVHSNNSTIVKAAEEIIKTLESEEKKFKNSVWNELSPIVSASMDFAVDKALDYLSKAMGPYVSFAYAICDALVGVGVSRAQSQSVIFAQVYLADSAKSIVKKMIGSNYAVYEEKLDYLKLYLTHLSQLRLNGELEYAQSRDNLSNLKIKLGKIEKNAAILDIVLSQKLIDRCYAVTEPNVVVTVNDDLYEKYYDIYDESYSQGAFPAMGSYILLINGERQFFLKNSNQYIFHLTAGQQYTIEIIEYHNKYPYGEYYYDNQTIYVKDGTSYPINFSFILAKVGQIYGTVQYYDSTNKLNDCDEAIIRFRKGYDNKTGDVFSGCTYPADLAFYRRYTANLPAGKYTAEVVCEGCETQYFIVESKGYSSSGATPRPYTSEYNFVLGWKGTDTIGGYTLLKTAEDDIPISVKVQLVQNGSIIQETTSGKNDGAFVFENVTVGKYTLLISSDEYVTDIGTTTYTVEIDLSDGSYSIGDTYYFHEMEEPITVHITGSIVDTSSNPNGVAMSGDVKVSFYKDNVYQDFTYVSNGSIDLTWVVEGNYKFVFEKDGYSSVTLDNIQIVNGENTLGIVKMCQTEVTFTITHGTDDILSMDSVEIYNGVATQTWTINCNVPWKIVTNRGDWFSLSVDGKSVGLNSTFEAGETELKLNITKHTDSRNDGTIAFEVGGETYTVEIFQKASIIASLIGTIKDGDVDSPTYGQLLEGVSLDVYDSAGKKVGDTAKSNENGVVAFDFPAADTYTFVFSLTGYETVTVDTVIINENTPSLGTYVMMRAETTTCISGTTTPGTKLELLDENGNVLAETVADENGKYEFTDIPGWDGTIFRIRIKDTTIIVDAVGGATGVEIDATVTIFTVSKPDTVQIDNEVGATSEWEIESSHAWSVTATGDTSWYTLSSTSGECGTTEFTVTANSVTDAYRESVLTFTLNNRTFDVTIYQDIARTTVSGTTTPGTKLELLDEDGNVIAETIADENGNYDFGDIPGWDGTIFRIRIKDTTLTTEVIGGATDVEVDATVTIFTVSVPEFVQFDNVDGAISEWEIESSHPWTVTKSGDTSWYTLNMESGNAGISDFVVTAIGSTNSYRESTLTFALNNRTFDVTIYQNFVQTVSGSIVEQTENSVEVGIENVEIVVRKADDSSWYSQTETDVNGQYTLVFEDAGEYVITAEKSGYTTVMVDFLVSSEITEVEKISMMKTVSPYYFNGHTYLPIFPSETSISWDDAEAICQSLGGHLVSITSDEENDFIKALTEAGLSTVAYAYTRTSEWWWIGAHKVNGSWAWADDDTFGSYTNWMGEPDSAAMYVMMYSKMNEYWSGYWQTIPNDGKRYLAGIICEWDYEIDCIEGVCSNNLEWKFTLDGTLTISGEGVLVTNGYNTAPWKDLEYNISKVELTSGITEIGQYGLYDTYYATEVILPDTLKTIHEYSSYVDSGYRKNYIVSADNTAFASVDGVLFTKDMTTLLTYPQYNERTEYSIPDGVNVIESLNGNALQVINIPASVKDWDIERVKINSLQAFNVDSGNAAFSSIDGILFNKSCDTLVKYPPARFAEGNTYRIPNEVTTINSGAFYEFKITDYNYDNGNDLVGSIIFPSSITIIGFDNFFFEDDYHYPHMNLYFEGNAPLIDRYYRNNSDTGDKVVDYTTVYYTAGKSGWTSPNWYPSYKYSGSTTKLTNIRIPTILQDAYATVSGQVVDANGAPLENVKVQGKYGDELTGIAYTGSDGKYTFQFESATTCDFRYYLDEYDTVFVDTVAIVGGEYSLNTVILTPGVAVLGSGTTEGGNIWTLRDSELIIECGESNSSGVYYLSSHGNEAIQEYSFWSPNDMIQIKKINISEGITKLRIFDISNDLSIEELYIGADVCEIEMSSNGFVHDYGFGNTDIVIDSENTNYVITDGALYTSDYKTLLLAPQRNYSITTYSIREGVEVIGKYAFNATNYKTVNIPNTVSTLKSSSFFNCELESIHIPASVTLIDGNVFSMCNNLSVITVDAANTEYMAADNILYNKAQTTLITVPCTLTGTLSIPIGINSIVPNAMENTKLDRIIIPESVTNIDRYAIEPQYSNKTCKVYFLGDVPNTVSNYAFGYNFQGTLYYIAGKNGWSTPTTVINGITYKTQPFTMDELH